MKHFNQISKILLIVVAIVGLAIGMSTVANYDNSSNSENLSIFADNNTMDSNCGSGKCGGDEAKVAVSDKINDTKAAIKEKTKCGEGKCGEGKCGGDDVRAANKFNFMDIDTNGDEKVSMAEFTALGIKEFPNKDANDDGKLTSDECAMFDSFNADENDYVSIAEFQAGHNKMFSKMDKNSDGYVNASESKSMHKSKSTKCDEDKLGEGKCGGDEAKAAVSDKVNDAKAAIKEKTKCGEGKCG